jgi:hypothetical protein
VEFFQVDFVLEAAQSVIAVLPAKVCPWRAAGERNTKTEAGDVRLNL